MYPTKMVTGEGVVVTFDWSETCNNCRNCAHVRVDNRKTLYSRTGVGAEYFFCTVCEYIVYINNYVLFLNDGFNQDFNVCSEFKTRLGYVRDMSHSEVTVETHYLEETNPRGTFLGMLVEKTFNLLKIRRDNGNKNIR